MMQGRLIVCLSTALALSWGGGYDNTASENNVEAAFQDPSYDESPGAEAAAAFKDSLNQQQGMASRIAANFAAHLNSAAVQAAVQAPLRELSDASLRVEGPSDDKDEGLENIIVGPKGELARSGQKAVKDAALAAATPSEPLSPLEVVAQQMENSETDRSGSKMDDAAEETRDREEVMDTQADVIDDQHDQEEKLRSEAKGMKTVADEDEELTQQSDKQLAAEDNFGAELTHKHTKKVAIRRHNIPVIDDAEASKLNSMGDLSALDNFTPENLSAKDVPDQPPAVTDDQLSGGGGTTQSGAGGTPTNGDDDDSDDAYVEGEGGEEPPADLKARVHQDSRVAELAKKHESSNPLADMKRQLLADAGVSAHKSVHTATKKHVAPRHAKKHDALAKLESHYKAPVKKMKKAAAPPAHHHLSHMEMLMAKRHQKAASFVEDVDDTEMDMSAISHDTPEDIVDVDNSADDHEVDNGSDIGGDDDDADQVAEVDAPTEDDADSGSFIESANDDDTDDPDDEAANNDEEDEEEKTTVPEGDAMSDVEKNIQDQISATRKDEDAVQQKLSKTQENIDNTETGDPMHLQRNTPTNEPVMPGAPEGSHATDEEGETLPRENYENPKIDEESADDTGDRIPETLMTPVPPAVGAQSDLRLERELDEEKEELKDAEHDDDYNGGDNLSGQKRQEIGEDEHAKMEALRKLESEDVIAETAKEEEAKVQDNPEVEAAMQKEYAQEEAQEAARVKEEKAETEQNEKMRARQPIKPAVGRLEEDLMNLMANTKKRMQAEDSDFNNAPEDVQEQKVFDDPNVQKAIKKMGFDPEKMRAAAQ